jgi:hypothetical protein
MQSTNPALRREPTAYFHCSGPAGQIFASVQRASQLRVGIVGLRIGTLAAYSRAGEDWAFFEIGPGVVEIARDPRYFTYLQDSPAHMNIVLEDARLKLADASDHRFDLFVLDAFSSDAIPMHLLTGEALDRFVRKLSETGVVLFVALARRSDEWHDADRMARTTPTDVALRIRITGVARRCTVRRGASRREHPQASPPTSRM